MMIEETSVFLLFHCAVMFDVQKHCEKTPNNKLKIKTIVTETLKQPHLRETFDQQHEIQIF